MSTARIESMKGACSYDHMEFAYYSMLKFFTLSGACGLACKVGRLDSAAS